MQSQFETFKQFISTYELQNSNSESPVVQRLKILCSESKNFVSFKIINPFEYIIFTEFESNQFGNISIGSYQLYDIVPFRSIIMKLDDENNVTISNYTINRIQNVTTNSFLDMMVPHQAENSNDQGDEIIIELPTSVYAYESYEGTVVLASKDSQWNIRTTSCPSAFNSVFSINRSHGDLFSEHCISNGYENWQSALDTLTSSYENCYFVFVVVNNESKYLCDYSNNSEFTNGSQVFLINVRTNDTHQEMDITLQTTFKIPLKFNLSDVSQKLNVPINKTFDKEHFLSFQGFIINDNTKKTK